MNEKKKNNNILKEHRDRVNSLCVHKGELFSGSHDKRIIKWNNSSISLIMS